MQFWNFVSGVLCIVIALMTLSSTSPSAMEAAQNVPDVNRHCQSYSENDDWLWWGSPLNQPVLQILVALGFWKKLKKKSIHIPAEWFNREANADILSLLVGWKTVWVQQLMVWQTAHFSTFSGAIAKLQKLCTSDWSHEMWSCYWRCVFQMALASTRYCWAREQNDAWWSVFLSLPGSLSPGYLLCSGLGRGAASVSWFERQVSTKEGRSLPWNGKCNPLPSELL